MDTGAFTVTLTVYNADGCFDVITYTVVIEGDYIIHAPNAFTPNGDGVNDVWFPKGIGIGDDQYELYIFNRWGQLIFESYDKNIGWDGTARSSGNLAKLDVYVWMIRTVDHNGEPHEYIGHVTVVR
jgi:gliding motility-associated-like protein